MAVWYSTKSEEETKAMWEQVENDCLISKQGVVFDTSQQVMQVKQRRAPRRDRTTDLSLTKRVLYHWAIGALKITLPGSHLSPTHTILTCNIQTPAYKCTHAHMLPVHLHYHLTSKNLSFCTIGINTDRLPLHTRTRSTKTLQSSCRTSSVDTCD